MIFFYFNLLESFYFNQRIIIIYFYLLIFLFKWIRNFVKKRVQEMKESFVEMKVQEEMKVLRNELEMSVAPMSR